MGDNLPEWRKGGPKHGWASPEGLRRLKSIIRPLLPFLPDEEQFGIAAAVMDGTHSLVIRATGSGKTMIAIIPLLARPDTMALVISPLNMLEQNMVRAFSAFSLNAVAINRTTLRAASKRGQDLWSEARTSRALFLGPELLSSDEFDAWIMHGSVRKRLSLCAIDEAHVIDLWAEEFRRSYKSVASLRSRLPPWVTILGLTATCRPGLQTVAVIEGLGLHRGDHVIYRGDCERHDLRVFVRPILHGISGTVFADLDWLVPPTSTTQTLVGSKTILYCNSIELGHRVIRYLRALLPGPLQPQQFSLIRHVHSLCCDECKREALDALCDVDGTVSCAIHVATDVVGFGVDAKGVHRVVCMDVPDELNTLVQRIGRTGRGADFDNAEAYIYLKQSTMIEAVTTELVDDRIASEALADLRKQHGTVHEVDPIAKGADSAENASQALTRALQRASAEPKSTMDKASRKRALLALVQAANLSYCLILRLNQLYGNPGMTPCGRCSSCIEDVVPAIRSATSSIPDGSVERLVDEGASTSRQARASMPKDLVQQAVEDLKHWRRREWLKIGDTSSFLDSGSILDDSKLDNVARSLLKLQDQSALQRVLGPWERWSQLGTSLWKLVQQLKKTYSARAKTVKSTRAAKIRRRTQDDDESSSDKENVDARCHKRRRGDRDSSPSPPYIPQVHKTRVGRYTALKQTPYDTY